MDTFRVRLNCVDYYQAIPNDEFDPPVPRAAVSENVKDRPRVSVLRVFGATKTGQKVLMHIHGAFQYTYIEYSGSLVPEDVDVAIKTLQLSIDHALAVSYRKNIHEGKHRYVAYISLVKGVPFYGFHVGYKIYLKIYLLNPLHITRLADLLREGAVMKRVLQPYESHMQYIAQWMCDYNLYGCAYIDCAKTKFRAPVPRYIEITSDRHQWHDRSILAENISDEFLLPKQSHCALEVDICVQDILNKNGIEARPLHHDFVERVRPLPIDTKLVQSMAGLWEDETRRRKLKMGINDPNSSPFPPEVLVTMSADPRNTNDGGWIHEEEFRQKIAQIAVGEHQNSDKSKLTFDTFVRSTTLESSLQTALDSVEDLYPHRIERLKANEILNGKNNGEVQIFVDESRAEDMARDDTSGSEEILDNGRASTDGLPSSWAMVDGLGNRLNTPISSSEYEKYGIRITGDSIDADADAFEIPEDVVQSSDGASKSTKRAQFAEVPVSKSRKRRKELMDANHILPDVLSSEAEDEEEFNDSGIGEGSEGHSDGLSNRASRPSGRTDYPLSSQAPHILKGSHTTTLKSLQNGTLPFPVVKNPSGPSTLLRLSQSSNDSQKLNLASPQKSGQSPLPEKAPQKSTSVSGTKTSTSAVTMKSEDSRLPRLLRMPGLQKTPEANDLLFFQSQAPRSEMVASTLWTEGLPNVIYQQAYYSNEDDVPEQAREYAGREFKLGSLTVPYLPDFDPTGISTATFGCKAPVLIDHSAEEVKERHRRKRCTHSQWSIADAPPQRSNVAGWLEEQRNSSLEKTAKTVNPPKKKLSQIESPTQKNKHGFKCSQKPDRTSVQHETQYMSIMSLEVHVNTRGLLAPNPDEDQIACVFWCVQTDEDEEIEGNTNKEGMQIGIIAVADEPDIAKKVSRTINADVEQEDTELDLLTRMVDIVRLYDPDILTGYEVHNSSWGYLIERARQKYDLNFCDEISRMKSQSHGRFGKDDDKWGFNHTSTIRVTGRHTINIWRAMRGELNLLQYTMENVAYHLLHKRIPHYAFADLTRWYKSKNPRDQAKVMQYFRSRVQIDVEILEANELVPRTSEQARLLGVDWFSVISRGSQFKVESLMFRIAKAENFILISPSRRQVGGQNALECLPLVMEPQSDFYPSPVLVLDFQSLYPSVMIAYNYCYSTFLGRIVSWRGTNKMGFTNYQREHRLIELLKDYINIAPNGIMYAKTEVRKSLLAKMLGEILETRVMVKSGMKLDKDDKMLQRLLNNRQLALKLIANVTYGYTSASFSGRMPCSEIADSIVQTGRETLEKAIAVIHSVERWGAEVVYGDTDSLFVYLKGRTREQAFDIGEEIADTITNMNPRPVKLKFEKVYHPCVLLAKKRYVGFKYESRKQRVPDFDAKGIETVRRDGTPAEQKIEENALKVLFRTADLSQVKSYFQAQCAKIMRGKVSIQDFCFAKEVRLGTYSGKGPPPPGALISTRKMVEDPRLEPQYGERVPYVVVTGGPQARLIDRCVAPEVLLSDAQSELDAEYYISKNLIPPLERIFNLVGANVRQWYDEMPKYQRVRRIEAGLMTDSKEVGLSKKTLESYMKASTCIVCREALDSESPLCSSCIEQASQSMLHLKARLVKAERKRNQLAKVCRSCSGLAWAEEVKCDSKDCPVFYSRTRQKAALASEEASLLPVLKMLEDRDVDELMW